MIVSIIPSKQADATQLTVLAIACLEQAYLEWELLLADGDASRQMLAGLAFCRDPRIRILEEWPHSAASCAERALGRSRGEVICWVDPRSSLSRHFLATLVDTFRSNAEVDAMVVDASAFPPRTSPCDLVDLLPEQLSLSGCYPVVLYRRCRHLDVVRLLFSSADHLPCCVVRSDLRLLQLDEVDDNSPSWSFPGEFMGVLPVGGQQRGCTSMLSPCGPARLSDHCAPVQRDDLSAVRVASCAIVIISHNYGRFLRDAILSSLEQSCAAHEILVVDDASTDNTADIACEWSGLVDYLRVNCRDPHESRAAGYNATESDVVVFLDADDRLSETYLESCMDVLNRGADVAYTPVHEFGDGSGVWVGSSLDLQRENYVHAGAAVRRTIVEKARAFETPNGFVCEDWEFWRRIERAGGRFSFSSAPYFYRRHSSSRSSIRPARSEVDRCVVGCYLSSQADPQRLAAVPDDDPGLVWGWAESLKQIWCEGVLLVDHDSPIVREMYPWITVVNVSKCPDSTHPIAWRWHLVEQYIGRRNLKSVFVTDVFDVQFRIDPFDMLSLDRDLWIGIEDDRIGDGSSASHWLHTMCCGTLDGDTLDDLAGLPILNCGIVGGWGRSVHQVAGRLWQGLRSRGPELIRACDMAVLNAVVYREWDRSRVWMSGASLHSRFKRYEHHRNDVCIIHK